MFCPSCGQQQTSEETKFCSRCGFLLTGVWELIAKGGLSSQIGASPENNKISPRRKGLKQGGQLVALGLIVVPLLVIISIVFHIDPALVIIISILSFWGGILRMLYARIFESKNPNEINVEQHVLRRAKSLFGKKPEALPPQSISVSSYAPSATGNWRNTKDLIESSVTEKTTRLLENDK